MISVRNVLVPIDFSKASWGVVKYALEAEEYKNDHLVLLHAYRLIADDFPDQRDSPVEWRKSIENKLLKTYSTFSSELDFSKNKHQVEFKMEVGFTVNCIRSLCRQNKIDLVLYAINGNKKNEQLADLIKLECSPIKLVSEKLEINQTPLLVNEDLSKDDFFARWDDCLMRIQQNPKLSFTVAPD
ncbi:MAG: universal stress protein [Reichenbachiella sp.]|uniref:universal stress protein n=1 Tax=Reichenbachiella sp. TaxID=2184521 RepID=UPI003296E93B